MDVTVEQQPDLRSEELVVVCRGRLGPGVAIALWATLEAMPYTSTVVVDVSDVESIDSHGLRALLGAAHRLVEEERLMAVHGAAPAVMAVLRSAGLHKWAALA